MKICMPPLSKLTGSFDNYELTSSVIKETVAYTTFLKFLLIRRRPVLAIRAAPVAVFILTSNDGAISGVADLIIKGKAQPEAFIEIRT